MLGFQDPGPSNLSEGFASPCNAERLSQLRSGATAAGRLLMGFLHMTHQYQLGLSL
ncbi:hypothetical protein THIX_20692 [Thiomonas sp. X19]|nr:hypothetical protein THIX_20692 [Thiomonas sp. X19]